MGHGMGILQWLLRLFAHPDGRGQGERDYLRLDTRRARPMGAFGWILDLPLSPVEGDSIDRPRHCLYKLFEDDQELKPGHSPHERIATTGEGYSVWGATLYFGLPEGSDPRRNGRCYALRRVDPSAGTILRVQGPPDPEAVQDALAEARCLGLLPDRGADCPVLGTCCRALPYPFAHALSVGNDVDSLTLDMVEAIHQRLERLGLAMGDSFWPCGHAARRPVGTPMLFDGGSSRLGPEAGRLLAMMQRGWIDSLHSWDDDFVSDEPLSGPLVVEARGDFDVALLELEPEASLAVGPYGLSIPIQIDGNFDRLEVVLTDQKNVEHVAVVIGTLGERSGWEASEWAATGRILYCRESNSVSVDLGSSAARITSVICQGRGDGRLQIAAIRPLGLQREVVESQLNLISSLRALPPVLFCHGGMRFNSALTTDAFEGNIYRDQVSVRGGADDPQSLAYHFDLLAARGVRLVWPARPVFDSEAPGKPLGSRAVPVQELLLETVARDATPHYLYPRFLSRADHAHPWHEAGGAEHHNENLGYQIARAIAACQQVPGGVAVVYMHWGCVDILERSEEEPFSLATQKALLVLAELTAGRGKGDGGRFWVSPSSVLGVYAAMIRNLPANVSVVGNRVDVSSWVDPRLGVIDDFSGFLHGATIYVDDAESAEVYLDGVPLRWFIRNPPDGSGRESVTLIREHGRVLLGIVSPEEQGMVVQAEGCELYHIPELRGGRLILGSSGRATVLYDFSHWPAYGYSFLRMACRKIDSARIGVELLFASGSSWKIWDASHQHPAEGDKVMPEASAGESFTHRCHAFGPGRQASCGKAAYDGSVVTGIRLHVEGTPGSIVEFADVALVAERARLRGRTCVVGGYLGREKKRQVMLRLGREERLTSVDEHGLFFFADVPRGEVAEICLASESGVVYPQKPWKFEVSEDCWDIRIESI